MADPDLTELLNEPDATITITRHELLREMMALDEARDADHGDAEAEALHRIRERLDEWIEDPHRRRRCRNTRP